MISGKPVLNPAMRALQGLSQPSPADAYRRQTEAVTQGKQRQIEQDQFTNNELNAQRYALDNSYKLQQNSDNPVKVTDTSMTISNDRPEDSGVSARAASASAGSGGGGTRQLPPDLAGRFMPLIQMGDLNPPQGQLPPQVSMPAASFTPQDATAYQDAAFARLKAKSGDLGRGAVNSLSSELAGRGISGASGSFGRGLADIVSSSVQPLADLNVAHLGQEYDAAGEARRLAEQRAGTEFSGGIQQRGQTIQGQQALDALRAALLQAKYSGEINQRGQDLDALYRFSR